MTEQCMLGWGVLETGLHDSKWCLCSVWIQIQLMVPAPPGKLQSEVQSSLPRSTKTWCPVKHVVSVQVLGTTWSQEGEMLPEWYNPSLLAQVVQKQRYECREHCAESALWSLSMWRLYSSQYPLPASVFPY